MSAQNFDTDITDMHPAIACLHCKIEFYGCIIALRAGCVGHAKFTNFNKRSCLHNYSLPTLFINAQQIPIDDFQLINFACFNFVTFNCRSIGNEK